MGKVLSVPIRRIIANPSVSQRTDILRAARRGFQGNLFAFDIDQTLVRTDKTEPNITTTFTNRPVLDSIARFLEREIPIAVISGNDMEKQQPRVIPPLEQLLQSRGELHLLRHFHFFANTGASRLQYKENGELDEPAMQAHSQRYGIVDSHVKVIREALAKILPQYEWQGNSKKRIETRIYLGALIQITIKEIEQSEREAAVIALRRAIAETGIEPSYYQVLPGGRTSIDISRSVIKKALSIKQMMEDLSLPEAAFDAEEVDHPIFYFGDEFTLKADDEGGPIFGNDISVLEIPNVIAFAVNADPSQVPPHPRLIRAGSGPQATLAILEYFSLISEAHRTVPRSSTIIFPDVRVPIIEETTVTIPEDLQKLDFSRTAIFMRINTLLADPSRKETAGGAIDAPESAAESPVLAPVIHLLKKGVKIVLLSGDARERQVKTIVDGAIFRLLKDKKQAIRNLTLYANGGATKTTFSVEDGKLVTVQHSEYDDPKKVIAEDLAPLVAQLMQEYQRRLQRKAISGDREAQLYLAESRTNRQKLPKLPIEFRSDNAQLSINYIIPRERSWMIGRLKELFKGKQLSKKYAIREGGIRTIDICSIEASKTAAILDYKATTQTEHVIYLGAEFFIRLTPDGQVKRGNDMEVFGIPGLIPLGFNQDQAEVHDLRNPLITAAGSGAEAAYVWLKHIADAVKLGIG